ncbi:hypothetical protein NC651_019039 [Populus alba x Populus x berolinensis]|nr:hypothetical protein NC651_019039 [Populus alba x Populus x berolinensis]
MEKSALAILMTLGLIEESKITRALPWRPPTNVFRAKEDVRPIFWANRPKSYLSRTIGWDQYPHGRWGDSHNPSYGTLSDYQFMRPRSRGKKLFEEGAGPLKSVEDIYEKFKVYCLGKLKSSPWSELEGLQPETKIINEQLSRINLKGFLTINSQLAVNAEKSDSPSVGWRGLGGYVYQKAYLEFFCSKEKLNALVERCKAFPLVTYMAVNRGGSWISNVALTDVNAVTWGVFPAKEISQPTVVDPTSFSVCKDEAFEIWSRGWASLYPEGDPSRTLLEEVQNSYFLVSLVENDYIHGDIFAIYETRRSLQLLHLLRVHRSRTNRSFIPSSILALFFLLARDGLGFWFGFGFEVLSLGIGFGFEVLDLRFRVSGFGFGVWGLRFRVLGFRGFRDSGFGFRVSGFGFRVSGLGFRGLGFGVWGFGVWGFGVGVSGFGFRVSVYIQPLSPGISNKSTDTRFLLSCLKWEQTCDLGDEVSFSD